MDFEFMLRKQRPKAQHFIFLLALLFGLKMDSFAISDRAAPLDGTFVDLGSQQMASLPDNKIAPFIDEIAGMGMHTIIIAATRVKPGKCEEPVIHWVAGLPEKLGLVLSEAEKTGIQVYIGLTSSEETCTEFSQDPNAKTVIADTAQSVRTLQQLYGKSLALAGWYIPDEPWYLPEEHIGYYRALVEAIHQVSRKPILVSPYLVEVEEKFTPSEVGAMAAKFSKETGIDVQLWQDSVGAQGTNLDWETRPRGLGKVEDYFRAISQAIGRDHLWSDNELFNCCVVVGTDYAQSTPYKPTSISRLNAQLWATRQEFTSQRVSWLFQRHMGTVDPLHYVESPRLKAAYLAFYGIKGTYVQPVSYEWLNPALPGHRDTGNEMFDRKSGDPKSSEDSRWVGFSGSTRVIIDLGQSSSVDWVGVHLLQKSEKKIKFPSELQVECSPDRASWSDLGKWGMPPKTDDGEYLLSNLEPLGAECRYLRITLFNLAANFEGNIAANVVSGLVPMTFISEIEIVSDH